MDSFSYYKICGDIRKVNHNAVPGANAPGPSFEGPTGEFRLSRTMLAELLRRLVTSAIGVDLDGVGDMLRFC